MFAIKNSRSYFVSWLQSCIVITIIKTITYRQKMKNNRWMAQSVVDKFVQWPNLIQPTPACFQWFCLSSQPTRGAVEIGALNWLLSSSQHELPNVNATLGIDNKAFIGWTNIDAMPQSRQWTSLRADAPIRSVSQAQTFPQIMMRKSSTWSWVFSLLNAVQKYCQYLFK